MNPLPIDPAPQIEPADQIDATLHLLNSVAPGPAMQQRLLAHLSQQSEIILQTAAVKRRRTRHLGYFAAGFSAASATVVFVVVLYPVLSPYVHSGARQVQHQHTINMPAQPMSSSAAHPAVAPALATADAAAPASRSARNTQPAILNRRMSGRVAPFDQRALSPHEREMIHDARLQRLAVTAAQ